MAVKTDLLAGDTSAEAWLKTLLLQELPAQAYGRLLLAPGAKAPGALQARATSEIRSSSRGRIASLGDGFYARSAGATSSNHA